MKKQIVISICASLTLALLLLPPIHALGKDGKITDPQDRSEQHPRLDEYESMDNVLILSIDSTSAEVSTAQDIVFYPSMGWFYENVRASFVIVKNLSGETIRDLRLQIAVTSSDGNKVYLRGEQDIETITDETQILEVPLILSETVLEMKDDLATRIEIELEYVIDNQNFIQSFDGRAWIRSRNSFDTSNLQMLAAFVTPKSSEITQFTRSVLSLYESDEAGDSLHKAAVLFDALGAYGIGYERDPNSPLVLGQTQAVDTVFIPPEVFQYQRGDCDDLAVLYASCLENIGIPTLFLFTSNHVFIAFDPLGGSAEEWINRALLTSKPGTSVDDLTYAPLDLTLSAIYNRRGDKRIWVPVETTSVGQTNFTQAVYTGIEELNKLQSGDDLTSITLEEAWQSGYVAPAFPRTEYEVTYPTKSEIDRLYGTEKWRPFGVKFGTFTRRNWKWLIPLVILAIWATSKIEKATRPSETPRPGLKPDMPVPTAWERAKEHYEMGVVCACEGKMKESISEFESGLNLYTSGFTLASELPSCVHVAFSIACLNRGLYARAQYHMRLAGISTLDDLPPDLFKRTS